MLVVDPSFGDRLWEVAARHHTWVVPSDVNKAAVEAIWAARRKEQTEAPSLTIWSGPTPAVTEQDWLSMLDAIEVHHGAFWCEPPLDTLSVYGAEITPAVTAALLEYDYEPVRPTELGFIAFKRTAA